MKKTLTLLLLFSLLCLPACGGKEEDKGAEFSMVAEIVRIENKIEVTVLESDVADGPYLVITSEDTVYKNAKGKKIDRDDLAIGDRILITYTGQVMMSIPPQIISLSIQLQ